MRTPFHRTEVSMSHQSATRVFNVGSNVVQDCARILAMGYQYFDINVLDTSRSESDKWDERNRYGWNDLIQPSFLKSTDVVIIGHPSWKTRVGSVAVGTSLVAQLRSLGFVGLLMAGSRDSEADDRLLAAGAYAIARPAQLEMQIKSLVETLRATGPRV